MPPKGSTKAPSCLGTVYPIHTGWRVRVNIGGRTVCGPYRWERSDADADLSQARGAETQEGYCNILKQLRESLLSKREEGVVGAGVVAGGLEAAGEASPQARKRSAAALQEDRDSGSGTVTERAHSQTPFRLGSVCRHLVGWRVEATLLGRTVCGPLRLLKTDAYADLSQARGAQTHEGYWNILKQLLLASVQSSRRGRVRQPAHRKKAEGVVGGAGGGGQGRINGGAQRGKEQPSRAGEKRPTESKKTMTQRRQTVFDAVKGSCGFRSCGNCGGQWREASQRDVSFDIKQAAVASTNMYRLH